MKFPKHKKPGMCGKCGKRIVSRSYYGALKLWPNLSESSEDMQSTLFLCRGCATGLQAELLRACLMLDNQKHEPEESHYEGISNLIM